MQKIVKFFITIIMIFGILLSNIPYYVVSSFVDSYIQTRGIVDKAWFAQQNDRDVVDTFSTLKEFSNKFKAYEAMAAVSYNSNGAFAYSASGGTSVSPAYPASIAAYDLLILTIGMKPSAANGGSVTTPGGWTPIVSLTGAGGYGTTLGADTGNTNVFTFYKVAAGTETGNLAVTIATNGVSWAQISRLSNASGSWSVTGTTGSDTSAGSVSIAFGADPGVTGGDYVIGAMTIPTNVTTPAQFSAEAFSQSGITFGTVTEIGEADSGTGSDIGGFRVHAPVSSGTSAGVPTMTATAVGTTTNVRGPGAFIRVRESNTAPTLTVAQPDGTGDTVTVGDPYNITYDLADPDPKHAVTAAMYYDTDAVGLNGTAITGACATAAEGTGATCSWDTTGMTPGTYYVYGITNDGIAAQVSDYSSGVITINAPANALTVSISGTQATNLNSGDTAQHIGGGSTAAFQLQMSGSAVNVNSVKLTEQGTITLSDLTSQKLYYESASTCTYNGIESNVTATPTGETVTFSLTGVQAPIAPNYLCLYHVFDLNGTNAVGGETIDIEISNPSTDIVLASGQNTDTAAKQLTGTTTVLPNATSVSYQGGAFTDGAQSGYSATITGAGFGVAGAGVDRANCSGAVNTGCVRFIVGGNATVASTDVTAWSSTSITFSVNVALASNGGASGLEVVAGSQADGSDLTFYIYPTITSVQNHVNVADGNYAREFYDTSDGEGIIRIIGDHFGPAGVVQILSVNVLDADEDNTTNTSDPATCAGGAYTDTCVRVRVPSSIADNLYTGNLKITRDSDSKENEWTVSAFRIFPRITALNPNTGIAGDPITIEGNHFCQSGTCPSSPNRDTTDNNVTFNGGALIVPDPSDVTGWTDAASPNTVTVNIPTGAATGNVQIESDVDGVVNDSNTATSNSISFTLGNATPDDAANLEQCTDSGCTSTISVPQTVTNTTIYFRVRMQVGTSGGTLCPQIEVSPIATAFDGIGADVYTGSGAECETSVTAGTPYNKIMAVTLSDASYHWRARTKHTKNSTDYYSANWVAFGANPSGNGSTDGSPANTDFRIDASGPVVSSVSLDTIGEFSATIHWSTDEDATANVEYRKSGSASAYFKAPKDLDTSTGVSPHAVTITDANGTTAANLTCNQAYEFKIIAKDNQNNTTTCTGAVTGFCPSYSTFSTSACTNRIMRSVEFYAIQPSGADSQFSSPYTNPEISTANGNGSFDVYLEETSPIIKSVFVEIAGVSSGSAALTLTAQVNAAPSKSFLLPVSTTPQPFKMLYQVPSANINVKNSGGGSANELQVSFSGPSSVSLTGAKVYVTYHYAP